MALLIMSCAVTNPYYEAEGIFLFRTCFLGGEKDLMVAVITEAFVQVTPSPDFCSFGVRSEGKCFSLPGISRFKF